MSQYADVLILMDVITVVIQSWLLTPYILYFCSNPKTMRVTIVVSNMQPINRPSRTICSNGTGRYLFDYTKSSTDKYISIIDFKEGKMIHGVYMPLSYNLKEKDIDRIFEL